MPGKAWQGAAFLGEAKQSEGSTARRTGDTSAGPHVTARPGIAGQGLASRGVARLGPAVRTKGFYGTLTNFPVCSFAKSQR